MEVNIDEKIGSVKFYIDEKYSHLKIKDTKICERCEKKPCLNFCPAGVYRLEDENKILISYQACLECGSCRVGCPFFNIIWNYPRSGFGVNYKFG
ncbi:MAG: ferredoxin family protein [Caldimicrobium sp.]